jgi:hypothetical protein
MAKRIPTVNASDIGKAAFCPHALCLQKKHRPAPGKREVLGSRAHAELNRELLSPQDKRCFIASYALGQDHHDTQKLRDWRDQCLLGTFTGRVLVQVYYWASPKLIAIFGSSQLIKRLSAQIIQIVASRIKVDQ